jgi:ribose transport system substrate-binding protein
MERIKIALFLITRDNDYQREQASVAEATARKLGMGLQVYYAEGDAIAQTMQILAAIRSEPADRPHVVVVEPVGTGMLQVATSAADNGIGWVVLNRNANYLAPLRQASKVPIGCVDSDNSEIGRVQAKQYAALLPAGGTVLYVEGPAGEAAQLRRAGLEETRSPNLVIKSVRGKWTEDSAFQALKARLQLAGSQVPSLIGCQNDAMAIGARKAVEALTDPGQREQWLKRPYLGVDGVASSGLAGVKQGMLTATIITPALSGIALELVAKCISSGAPMPERTLTKPTSYPPIEQLRSRAAAPPPGAAVV